MNNQYGRRLLLLIDRRFFNFNGEHEPMGDKLDLVMSAYYTPEEAFSAALLRHHAGNKLADLLVDASLGIKSRRESALGILNTQVILPELKSLDGSKKIKSDSQQLVVPHIESYDRDTCRLPSRSTIESV